MGVVLGLLAAAVPASAARQCALPGPGEPYKSVPAERLDLDPGPIRRLRALAEARGSITSGIYRHGCLVAESDYGANQRFESFSAAKSVTAMVALRAMSLGMLSADDPMGAHITEADKAHGAIKVRQLLTQTSGLRWNFARDYNVAMADRIRDGLTLDFAHAPGTHWEYFQTGPALVTGTVEQAVGMDFQAFAQKELFGPLGIGPHSWSWTRDATGNTVGFYGISMARDDWARLSGLMMAGGVWKGERLLDKGLVRDALTPTRQNPGYGYLFWLNKRQRYISPTVTSRAVRGHRFVESLTPDMFTMAGFLSQINAGMPSLDMQIVRMGLPPSRSLDLDPTQLLAEGGEFEHESGRLAMKAVRDVDVPDPGPYPKALNLPQPSLEHSLITSLLEPGQILGGVAQAPLPPAGPRRAHALVLDQGRARVERGSRVRIRLRCSRAVAAGPCRGRVWLKLAGGGTLASAPLSAPAGGRVMARLRVPRSAVRRARRSSGGLQTILAARNDDSTGGTMARRGFRLLP